MILSVGFHAAMGEPCDAPTGAIHFTPRVAALAVETVGSRLTPVS